MRKPDRRGRRVRNTLNVDLGLNGLPLLDACLDKLSHWRRAKAQVKGSPMKRGEVIRIALQLLHLELLGESNTLKKAIDLEAANRAY